MEAKAGRSRPNDRLAGTSRDFTDFRWPDRRVDEAGDEAPLPLQASPSTPNEQGLVSYVNKRLSAVAPRARACWHPIRHAIPVFCHCVLNGVPTGTGTVAELEYTGTGNHVGGQKNRVAATWEGAFRRHFRTVDPVVGQRS